MKPYKKKAKITTPKRVPLTPRFGFIPTFRGDIARLREHGGTSKVRVFALIAVWQALCDLANEMRSNVFIAGRGLISYRAGVSKRTLDYALDVLELELRMIRRKTNRNPERPKELTDSTYFMLLDSVLQVEGGTYSESFTSAKAATRKRCTTPIARKEHDPLQGCKTTPTEMFKATSPQAEDSETNTPALPSSAGVVSESGKEAFLKW